VSPDSASRCDCGFDFVRASPEIVKAELASAQAQALRGAIKGLVIGVGAILASFATYAIAKPGGSYWLFYGGVFGGLALTGRSLTRLLDIRNARKDLRNVP